MKKQEFTYKSFNGKNTIRAMRYIPEKDIVAVLQIAHGMVEFIDRYEDFAKFLCDRGILVTGNDHLGHGGSVDSEDDWGYFGKDGNTVLIEDMNKLTDITKELYPDKPYFLLGHSMGSFYARQYLMFYGSKLTGAIIMGTGMESLEKIKGGLLLCRMVALFKGWRHRSKLINSIAFGTYNKQFEPARTRVDWLSKDEKLVDWYINEPRCSFVFTVDGYYNMFTGLTRLHDKKLLNQMPKQLPVFFVAGKDDPVGGFGKEVENSAKSFIDAGMMNVSMKLYPNDRHEIVYQDLYEWIIDNVS